MSWTFNTRLLAEDGNFTIDRPQKISQILPPATKKPRKISEKPKKATPKATPKLGKTTRKIITVEDRFINLLTDISKATNQTFVEKINIPFHRVWKEEEEKQVGKRTTKTTIVKLQLKDDDESSGKIVHCLNRKKWLENDNFGETEQDNYFWILLHGIKNVDRGYLHDERVAFIAQEIEGGFLLLDRKALQHKLYDYLPQDGSTVSKPNEAIYKNYKIGLRKEMKTLIPAEDIMNEEKFPGCLISLFYKQ